MSRRVRRVEAQTALLTLISDEVRAVAGNRWLSREESPKLDALIRRAEAQIRAEGGKGTRVRVEDLITRSVALVQAAWDAVDPPLPGLDGALLSKDEIRAILAADPEAGALLSRVAEFVRAAGTPAPSGLDDAELVALKSAIEALDLSEGADAGLAGATRFDARAGHSARAGLPAAVLSSFDWYYRAEKADWASCGLWRVTLGGADVYLVYTSSDGDDCWLETFATDGTPALSARFLAGTFQLWDEFFGRARLSASLLEIGAYKREEGLSEEAERVAAGQPSLDWTGELTLDSGTLAPAGFRVGTITLDAALSETQRELAFAAFDLLWGRALRPRATGGVTLTLGPRRAGVLYLGPFTRPTTGVSYEVARWRDIDDASFVLYFSRDTLGLHLSVEQFDN